MNPLPLTSAQQTTIENLERRGQLRTMQSPNRAVPDLVKAENFVDQAIEALADVSKVTSSKVVFDMTYNIAHDVGEAALAAYGYRTGSGTGQHQAVGEARAAIFDTPPDSAASQRYDNFGLTRNGICYRASPVSPRDTREGVQTATDLLDGDEARLGYP